MSSKRQLDGAKRIVVKVGTSTLIHPNGRINLQAIDQLSFSLSGLVNEGKQVVLVSSGAIGVGMGQMGLDARPEKIPEQQALASMGQCELMTIYQQRFTTYGQKISQVLLTHDVLDYPESRQNVFNTLDTLLEWGIIPIINENDTIAVDNDQLSAIVADIVGADLLIMLSDIDGFFNKNPRHFKDAKLIDEINKIDSKVIEQAGGKGTKFGTGGMMTKLKAAKRILKHDRMMILANGENPSIIFKIMNGDKIGTLFRKK